LWVTPIYDRTQLDVTNKTAKGYYNYTDLNRIEQDCDYLAALFGITITTKEWARTDFPTLSEMNRIKNNIVAVRNAYHTYVNTPATPNTPYNTYLKANDIEKILNDIKALYDINSQDVFYAGEIYSGETIGVI
jgi:hypothetical protein